MIVRQGQQYGRVTTQAGGDISADVLAQLTVKHGHELLQWGSAAISTAQFTVYMPQGAPYTALGGVGDTVTVDTGIGPQTVQAYSEQWSAVFGKGLVGEVLWDRRFTGHITDINYKWEKTAYGWYLTAQVQCVGHIARLGSRLLPYTAWGQEPARNRASNFLAEAWNGPGETFTVQTGDYNPTLKAEEQPDRAGSALAALEAMTAPAEATLFDRPDAGVVWQELAHRKATPIIDLTAAGDAVVFAPDYTQRLDFVNAMTIDYGTDQTVTSSDPNSQARWGMWAERNNYPYANGTDAQIKADRIVRRQAMPAVAMPGVTVLLNRLDPDTFTAVRALQCGDKVRLPGLPDPYPADATVGQNAGVWVVEGWTETAGSKTDPDAEWRLTMHLSPPIYSLVGLTWAAYALTGNRWQDVPATTWDEIGRL